MARRRFTERQVLECLAWQGVFVCCHRCGKPFFEVFLVDGEPTLFRNLEPEREHLHEYALNGPDEPGNCRYGCAPCHSIITNGTKATSAGSSKHRIAKVKRLRGETKTGPKKKIGARGFDKTLTRKFSGETVKRAAIFSPSIRRE